MLTCVFHPLDKFRVVEHEEAERLLNTGVWFDCPNKAKDYKENVEKQVKKEKDKPKSIKSKNLGEDNERRQNGSI